MVGAVNKQNSTNPKEVKKASVDCRFTLQITRKQRRTSLCLGGGNMEVGQLKRSFLEYIAALFREGLLDGQFSQLQLLQDESNSNFVFEVVSLFFEDSERLLNELTKALDQQNVDFKKIDAHVHQLKGSSSSIGAHRVKNACITFRNCCDERNIEACLRCLQEVKQENLLAKTKLDALFQLEQQILAAGGAIPIFDEFS